MKKRRLDLGLTQKKVAERLGVDEMTVVNWEKRRMEPSLPQKRKVIEFLGYSPIEPGPRFLGERICKYRETRGLSQEELARALGVDPSTLKKWEWGERIPSKETLERIRKSRAWEDRLGQVLEPDMAGNKDEEIESVERSGKS